MVAKINSAQITGLKTDLVEVEVDINRGLQSFAIVGLPDKAVAEAKDRINSAIKNSGFKPPQKGNKKVVVSLAPANIKKEGSNFDLAIALGYLLASGEIKFEPKEKLFVGELALDGSLRPTHGALLIVQYAKERGYKEVYLPEDNANEASLIHDVTIYPCSSLKQIICHLRAKEDVEHSSITPQEPTVIENKIKPSTIDFSEIKGQLTIKRGLEIAAAGGHNVAMYGPPGTGKTMLARAFTGIMPPLELDDIIEVTGIHSASGQLLEELITEPPFRSPHHTSSYVSLVGGGTWPKPGEITMAHRGVLFMDEFPEFDKKVLEALRQPLEDRVISVARAKGTINFPADFLLIAALNPCPCGYRGSKFKDCTCTQAQIQKYSRKVSGPIIDRIDIWLNVPQVNHEDLSNPKPSGESSHAIRQRIISARERQNERFSKIKHIKTNGNMGARELKLFAPLEEKSIQTLNIYAKQLNLSARAYHRVIKLARTIADLDNSPEITESHLLEALQYRPKNIFE